MPEGKTLGLTRVSQNFQTRIPMEAARFLEVKVGDKVLWRLEGKKIVVEKA
jgi:bifunctional DNA-binding transcriptional regulator/antitoxin component of YhaV-PrlF toxin-antitoxin module